MSELVSALAYRVPMKVQRIRRIGCGAGASCYPVCPQCGCSLEREYQAFCDRCGQALNWKQFRNAEVVMV